MLKITINDSGNTQTILLEGKIVGPWVEEFKRVWGGLKRSAGAKQLRLDLRSVTFVDEQGRRLLQEIYQETKASFLANSPLTHYFASEAMQPRF
jgi:anti-anti-sigma regulatory factor